MDIAQAELQAAGYEVLRLPERYRSRLFHPLDDFIEVQWTGEPEDSDVRWREVEGIVGRYGGYADSCGEIEPGYVPFAEVWSDLG
jgi:hypothetical protein